MAKRKKTALGPVRIAQIPVPSVQEQQETFARLQAALVGHALGRYFEHDANTLALWLGIPVEDVDVAVIEATNPPALPVRGVFFHDRNLIQLDDSMDADYRNWILAHECAHSLGLRDEHGCNLFAQAFRSGAAPELLAMPGARSIAAGTLAYALGPEREKAMLPRALYIEDAESIAAYGVRERWVQFKDILPLGLTSGDFAAAAQTLYGMAVNYLSSHLSEQLAYEVEVLGLKHVNPDTGVPYFKVGDKIRVQFDGWTQDADGNRTTYLTVDTSLYILDFTRTFNSDGSDTTKLTLSTFLRALPSDSEAFIKLAKDVGIEQVAPLAYFTFGNGAIRMDETSIQLRTNGSDVVAIYGLDELSATPGNNPSYWKLAGQANDAILENDVTLGLYTQGTARSRLYLAYGSFSQASLYVGSDLGFRAGNFNNDVGSYLAPIVQPTLSNPSAVSYTIATDAINIDISSYWVNGELEYPGVARVDTEAAAATDNLATISGTALRRGQLLVVMAKDTTHTVVCKDGTGNLQLAGDMTLDNAQDTLTLMYDGSNWVELARSNNGA